MARAHLPHELSFGATQGAEPERPPGPFSRHARRHELRHSTLRLGITWFRKVRHAAHTLTFVELVLSYVRATPPCRWEARSFQEVIMCGLISTGAAGVVRKRQQRFVYEDAGPPP